MDSWRSHDRSLTLSGVVGTLLLVAILVWSGADSAVAGQEARIGSGTDTSTTVAFGWRAETVDVNGGSFNSIALDSTGRPRIAYFDHVNGDLKYAYKDDSGWHLASVDTVGTVGGYPSLALSPLGLPRISYCSMTDNVSRVCIALKYAAYDGTIWNIQTIDAAGNVGSYTSLAFDSFGAPHVTYYDSTNGNLKLATYTMPNWVLETVDTAGDVGQYTSLEILSNAEHISYYGNGNLKYAYHDPANPIPYWNIMTIDSTAGAGLNSSLAICPTTGSRNIAYRGSNNLRYYWRLGNNTAPIATVDTNILYGGASIALTSGCQPRISYYDIGTSPGYLKYAYKDNSGWHTVAVDDYIDAGNWDTSLALDSANQPHISYLGDVRSSGGVLGLKYAYKVNMINLPFIVK